MRFSIVIPTLNRSAIVPDAIRSVHAQQEAADGRVEIVMVDESTDDTVAVAERVAAEVPQCRLVVHRPERRMGVTGARNKAIELASGDIVVVLDSDDQLTDGALAYSERFLSEHPDVAVLFGRVRNKSGRPASCRKDFLDRLVSYEELIQADVVGEFLPLVRRRALIESGLRFEEQAEGAEGILWRRLPRAGYKVWYTSTVMRLYDDIGADRNSTPELRIKRASVFAQGHIIELKEFGADLRRISRLKYIKKVLKTMTYSFLAVPRDPAGDAFLHDLNPGLYATMSIVPAALLQKTLELSIRARQAGIL